MADSQSLAVELHPWRLGPNAAVQLQSRLREQLVLDRAGAPVSSVAGIDVSVGSDQARAAIVIVSVPALEPLEAVTAEAPLNFPYIPGQLSFREGPAILAARAELSRQPHLLLFDRQGIAHSRGTGIAAHMGLWLNLPSIGVAKSRLYWRHLEPGHNRGDQAELLSQRQPPHVIGAVVPTRPGTNPLHISPGHLIDVPHAIELVLACVTRYRLPELTRWAHKVAGGDPLPSATAVSLF